MMLSFWEQNSLLKYDYIVVGAGISGLSTAISLKEKSPNVSVLVLERGLFPTGASTKNAGFACFGSLTELISDLQVLGADRMLTLVERRWKGLQLLRARLGDSSIDFQPNGGYELLTSEQKPALAQIPQINELLHGIFDRDIFHLRNDLLPQFGFNNEVVTDLMYSPLEGQIDTGMMMRSLWQMASTLGVVILTQCEVESIDGPRVHAKSLQHPAGVTFEASQVAICTNAFTGRFFPEEDIQPGRGIVLITQPIEGLPFKGVFHFDEGYYYFRNWHDRVIFGGGRNLDFAVERTTDMGINERILADLQHKLVHLILPGRKADIAHTWAGIMAFGSNKEPIVKRVNEHLVMGVRLGGMGVAIGSLLGKELAEMMG